MSKIEKSVLENLYGKYIATESISIQDEVFGDDKKHTLKFDIYDGFAYCENYKGDEYCMTYPKKEFINLTKEMAQAVREYVGLKDEDPVQVIDILLAYNTIYKI